MIIGIFHRAAWGVVSLAMNMCATSRESNTSLQPPVIAQAVSWSSARKESRGVCASRIRAHTSICAILCARKKSHIERAIRGSGNTEDVPCCGRLEVYRAVYPNADMSIPPSLTKEGKGRTRRASCSQSYTSTTHQAATALTLPFLLHQCCHHRGRRHLLAQHPPHSQRRATQRLRPLEHTECPHHRGRRRAPARRSTRGPALRHRL
jgi:hypothetical protein